MITSRRVCLILFVLLFVGALSATARAGVADPDKDLDQLQRLELFQPGEPSVLYDRRDEPLAPLVAEYRIAVPLSRIPKLLQQAVLDVEDARFYEHGAISLKGMARAAIRNLTSGHIKEGGSTITQQLAKALFLSGERTLSRKMREIELAREIEQRYSKDKILEMYLNAIYFGGGAYGIEAAARTYFSKSVGELTLPEAALLAGLPKAPSTYSPFTDLARARERRNVVLSRMAAEGHLAPGQAQHAMRQPVTLAPFFKARGEVGYFMDFIRKELEPKYGRALARGGLKIYSTLDLELQRQAMQAVRAGVQGIERTLALRRKGTGPEPSGLEATLTALDPATGEILVMVGGLDYARSQFNRVVQARRQPGSAFKPFVYLAALERGYSPTDLLEDYPVSYTIPTADGFAEWSPVNFDRQFRGLVTVREALEESINVPTVRLLEAVGVDAVIDMARRLGVRSELRREYGLALGVSEVSLLELTSAYGVLANEGIRMEPTAVRRVVSGSGEVLEERWQLGQRVLSEEVAFVMTSLLQGAASRGTAKRAAVPGWDIAAKTGTSQDAADLWLMGYTPRLVTGLWVGFDRPRALGAGESAGRLAAPVWADFMRRALHDQQPETPPMPETILPILVNRHTGALTDGSDPERIQEFVIRGDLDVERPANGSIGGTASGPPEPPPPAIPETPPSATPQPTTPLLPAPLPDATPPAPAPTPVRVPIGPIRQ